MQITDKPRAIVVLKEKQLPSKYPQLTTHFEFDIIFPGMYVLI